MYSLYRFSCIFQVIYLKILFNFYKILWLDAIYFLFLDESELSAIIMTSTDTQLIKDEYIRDDFSVVVNDVYLAKEAYKNQIRQLWMLR